MCLMIGLIEEVPSSRVPVLRSWVQFSLVTQFFAAHISPSLASAGPAGTADPEWGQTAPTTTTHTLEAECWTIA
jgi:hypothetical protein